MNANTMYLTIVAPNDGGIVIYESSADAESVPVFGGNLEEATRYFQSRATELQSKTAKAENGAHIATVSAKKIHIRPEPLRDLAPVEKAVA